MERNAYIDAGIGALAGVVIGVLAGSIWLTISLHIPLARFDPLEVFNHSPLYARLYPRAFGVAWGLVLLAPMILIGLALTNRWFRRTNDYGDAHWQTRPEIRRSGLLDEPGLSFIFGKMGKPGQGAPFLTGKKHPHCLMVAPTGAGKGVGFVIPNLLMFVGSTITLDIKGENYEKTARHRANVLNDKVIRFDPLDLDGRTHRFNPLAQVAALDSDTARYTELARMAELFIQDLSGGKQDWIDGAKRLFIAGALHTVERRDATLGAILRLFQVGADQKETLAEYARETRNPQVRGIFNEYAGMPERTLGSYISILTNAGGLGLWSNPLVDHATSRSDWEFGEFRRRGHSLYLCSTVNDLKALAPLMRLLFGQAVASLQAREPGPDEHLPVMFMVDEFDQLGRLDLFVESMKTLRSFGGRVMIVTQSVPGLDAIYGENKRLSIEAAAGVKLYITPQDPKTARELSQAIGNETRLRQSISRKERDGFFSRGNVSLSEEARPLLSEQDARRLDPETIIILPAGQHPIKAHRIKYFEDRVLATKFDKQSGPLPHEAISAASVGANLVTMRAEATERELLRANTKMAEIEQALGSMSERIEFFEKAFENRDVENRTEDPVAEHRQEDTSTDGRIDDVAKSEFEALAGDIEDLKRLALEPKMGAQPRTKPDRSTRRTD